MRAVIALAIGLLATPVMGAQATRDWPCVQVRQPHLSVGSMWTGPLPDEATAALARQDREVATLADRLAQRRTTPQEAEGLVADFAATADAARLTALFQGVFDRIDAERTTLMDGIARFGAGQAGLAAEMETRRARMQELEAAASPDFDAIDAEEAALDWDRRIFEERQHMLTAVCESPVLLEKRLYELSRMIQSHLPPE
ncbi:hypothetical protein GI374_14090 [Paracoccus sp. S-4012]|uniref:hypothetical protein n=1 Tax=Paracoccus sp. S-4012 TaxID=2665648 RepID=UPI0012B134DB|nr:hypothetical protein [Paracoccus sp. S-4012]MRX51549.1 hypothetical protein [Paracoccus sp. S-4012]